MKIKIFEALFLLYFDEYAYISLNDHIYEKLCDFMFKKSVYVT